MHMASTLLSAAVAGTTSVGAVGTLGYTGTKHRGDFIQKKWMMAAAGATVFAAQMVNFSITGTGSSGHFAGGFLLAALLGSAPGYVVMSIILAVQCLFFGDGGIMALGSNILNMGFIPCFLIYPVVAKYFLQNSSRGKRAIGFMIGGFISVVIGAIAVSVETAVSGISGMSVGDLFVNMLGIHCLIGIAEGIISFALYEFVTGMAKKKERYGVFAMGYMAVITSGILSLFASANPDGLEWSLIRVIGEADIQATTGIHMFFERIQEATALFPDYAMKTVDTLLSSSVVGMIGCGLVFAFVIAMASTVKVCRVKNRK